jgi:hypothetical protein
MANKRQTELSAALQEQSIEIAKATKNLDNLANRYRSEELVSMAVSPLYRPYFGNVMKVSINGISIYMPIDNTTHKIPKTFADEIHGRIMAIDAIMKKQDRMSDIANNLESTPGELPLV